MSIYSFSPETGGFDSDHFQGSDLHETTIHAAINFVQESLTQFASSSVALSRLESVFEIADRDVARSYLTDWSNGIFPSMPDILLLNDEVMSGARGGYSAKRHEIYIAESVIQSDPVTGLRDVLLEEFGHAVDSLINPGADTAGDEGQLFSLIVQNDIRNGKEIEPEIVQALKAENDWGWVTVNGDLVTVEQAAPNSFYFSTTQNTYDLGQAVSLTNAWAYDADGYSDLAKVDFWLRKEGGTWQNISDTKSFTPWANDNRWASFNKTLKGLAAGNYTLWGIAYDKSGEKSTAYTATFSINSPKPDLGFNSYSVPTAVIAEDVINLSVTAQNFGSETAGYSYVRYWLSDDATLNTSTDRYLGNSYIGSLASEVSENVSFSFTHDASWGTGTKYIFFEADGYDNVAESNELNNCVYKAIVISPKIIVPTTYQPFDANQVFSLNSNLEANHTIYLDFTGHTTTGTLWNTKYTGGNDLVTPVYDTDGNPTSFSINERETIWNIWRRVAEDFIPFDINVTTVNPSVFDLIKSDSDDIRWGVRVAIGGNSYDWYGQGVGGIAYRNSFSWSTDTPTFVFSENLSNNEKYIAEAISHEVGHTLGLSHDGDTVETSAYYIGHGIGTTGWASIMGVGYYQNVTQWSHGEYYGADNREDDLAIITSGSHGFGYRLDDYGDQLNNAELLSLSSSAPAIYGIVETNTDFDWFVFHSTTGNISLDIRPFERGPNLDVLVSLYDGLGQLISIYNPLDELSVTINCSLTPGTYYLSVTGTGVENTSTGYSDYGSLGQYSINGTIA